MSDFIQRESDLQKIPSFLVSRVSGFRESPEYRQMRDYELDIPGVVCGAFAQYLGRIHAEQATDNRSESTIERALASAQEAIETMASSPETAVHCLVTDEIFENLECEPDVLERIKSHLRPNAQALYRRWIGEASV